MTGDQWRDIADQKAALWQAAQHVLAYPGCPVCRGRSHRTKRGIRACRVCGGDGVSPVFWWLIGVLETVDDAKTKRGAE